MNLKSKFNMFKIKLLVFLYLCLKITSDLKMSNNNSNGPTSGRFICYNSGGLPKERCALIRRHLFSELKPLVLMLNETKLTTENENKINELLELNKLGYSYKVKSRPPKLNGKNPGGGVAFIYRDNLKVKEIKIPSKFSNIEAIVCNVGGSYIIILTTILCVLTTIVLIKN